MQHEGALFALSEFAIGLAGFSAIVVALGHRSGSWDEAARYRLRLLLLNSVGAGLLALFPAALFSTGLSEESVWQLASVASMLFLAAAQWFVVTVPKSARTDISVPLRWVGSSLALLAFGGLLLNVLDVVYRPQAAPYLFTLLLLLLIATIIFLRVVLHRPGSAA